MLSPLAVAIWYNETKIVELLESKGVEISDESLKEALVRRARDEGDIITLRKLRTIETLSSQKVNELRVVANKNNDTKMIEFLESQATRAKISEFFKRTFGKDNKDNGNKKTNKKTMSQIAAEDGDPYMLEFIVMHDLANASPSKAFEAAGEKGDRNALRFLSKYKIDDSSKKRVFEILFKKGDIKTAEFLVSLGIEISKKILLMSWRVAIEEDDINILKFLHRDIYFFDLIYDINRRIGEEYITKAIKVGATKVAEFLIEDKGIYYDAFAIALSPLAVAISYNETKIVELLESKGVEIPYESLKQALVNRARDMGDRRTLRRLRTIETLSSQKVNELRVVANENNDTKMIEFLERQATKAKIFR